MNGNNAAMEIRRERVQVPEGMTALQLMKDYGLKSTQAYNSVKRGWFIKNYSKKQVIVDSSRYDSSIAYCIARKIFKQNFSRYPLAISLRDDLIQEAVTRMYELSGRYKDNGKYTVHYHFHWVAHNAMQSFLKTWKKQMKYSRAWEDYVNPIRSRSRRRYHPTYGWLYW